MGCDFTHRGPMAQHEWPVFGISKYHHDGLSPLPQPAEKIHRIPVVPQITTVRIRQLCRSGSFHLPDHVFSAERIWRAERAFGIIMPLSIHGEPIVMRAGRQFHRRPPDAIGVFFHVDGVFLPLREVAHQLHAQRVRRGDGESLFPASAAAFGIYFLCHIFPFPNSFQECFHLFFHFSRTVTAKLQARTEQRMINLDTAATQVRFIQ